MALSKSCCCSCFNYTLLAVLVVLVAIIVKHKNDEMISPQRNTDEDLLENKLVDAVQELRYDLIRRFPNKKPKSMPLVDSDATISGVRSVKWVNRSSFDEAVENKRPFVLSESPAANWEALSWDLWNISTRWPLLNNVLVTEDESFMVLQQVFNVLYCTVLCCIVL